MGLLLLIRFRLKLAQNLSDGLDDVSTFKRKCQFPYFHLSNCYGISTQVDGGLGCTRTRLEPTTLELPDRNGQTNGEKERTVSAI